MTFSSEMSSLDHDGLESRFEAYRPALIGLAYRMLGDLQRAEDLVQDAWIRWSERQVPANNLKAYLAKIVTRLCLNELSSARVRHEVGRADRLPEFVDLDRPPFDKIAHDEDLSAAVMVMLQKLTAAERAVLLLHDIFGFSHREIADIAERSEAACRQLVSRARAQIKSGKRVSTVSDAEHRRLLGAFITAARAGDIEALTSVLAEDVVFVVDAGSSGGRFGGAKNLPGPLVGRTKVSAFVAAITPRGSVGLDTEERYLNGQPTVLVNRDGKPFAVISISIAEGRIVQIFIQNDAAKLRHLI